MFGVKKPQGVLLRHITLDPKGNCEEAEAARAALTVYGQALSKSSHERCRERGQAIVAWVEEETAYAENFRIVEAQMT